MAAEEMTLYKALSLYLASPGEDERPLDVARARLRAYVRELAPRLDEDPNKWNVTVERSPAGVRLIVNDESGTEVDLDRLPANVEELDAWLS